MSSKIPPPRSEMAKLIEDGHLARPALLKWEVWTGREWVRMAYAPFSSLPHEVVNQVHDEIVLLPIPHGPYARGGKPRFKVRQCL
jgi:hypothetical protein